MCKTAMGKKKLCIRCLAEKERPPLSFSLSLSLSLSLSPSVTTSPSSSSPPPTPSQSSRDVGGVMSGGAGRRGTRRWGSSELLLLALFFFLAAPRRVNGVAPWIPSLAEAGGRCTVSVEWSQLQGFARKVLKISQKLAKCIFLNSEQEYKN